MRLRRTTDDGRRTRPKGQTLVELLIASAVISTGLFAAATLVFSNLQLSDRDSDEVVAVNLAREGIEQSKELRDSNWLAGLPFDEGLHDGADYSATPLWDGTAAADRIRFDFRANDLTHPNAIVRQSADPATPGFYTQTDASAPETPWRRLLIFHPICESGGAPVVKDEGEICDPDVKVGVRIESRVHWTRRGNTFDRVIYEDLYDWR